jgi:glyceraldehyde-3-phosphate dehydrogenase (NADP+)
MRMLIGGEWVDRADRIDVRDPQHDLLVDTVPRGTREDALAAIAVAADWFDRGCKPPTHERMRVLRAAADHVLARHEDFARTIASEGIKTIREARKEVTRCVETLRLSAEEARRVTGETIPFDQMPGSEGRLGWFSREPIGVIAAITPFNDPLNLVAHKIGPAIAAGNPIVVKPHSKTPLSALLLAQALDVAGVPAGMLQVVTGNGAEVGDAMVTDPRVRMVSFTGGRATGEAIARRAGPKKIAMELGSNCPVLVFPDADLDHAAAASVSGAFWAAGQNCLHVQRILVHEEVYAPFRDCFVAGAAAYQVGDKQDEATDMGPLIDEAAACRVASLADNAVAAGARLLTGGERSGTFLSPTVLEHVPLDHPVHREEVYGPVTVLAPFAAEAEGIALANRPDYGLHAAVFTGDVATAFRVIGGLRCGGVMVNDSTDYRIDAMPFGGVKGSGLGREGVRFALEEMTEPKVVCLAFPPPKAPVDSQAVPTGSDAARDLALR